MPTTRTKGELIERWVFCNEDLQAPEKCSGFDELAACPSGYESGIMVQRNGIVTNCWADGTKGVGKRQKADAEAEDTLYATDNPDLTYDEWLEVVTNKDGKFIRFATDSDKEPFIKAETHDDNHDYEVTFDAVDWFEQASAEEIFALAKAEWGGDYEADGVAEFFDGVNDDVTAMFKHKKDCGFECHVDEESAMAWLKANRPEVHEAIQRELV